jgi:hypothetical protein
MYVLYPCQTSPCSEASDCRALRETEGEKEICFHPHFVQFLCQSCKIITPNFVREIVSAA